MLCTQKMHAVSAVRIGHNYVPDRRQCCQEVPKRILTTLAAFLCFFHRISAVWGGWRLFLFVPNTALWLGGLKRQDTQGWFLTTCMFWDFLSP